MSISCIIIDDEQVAREGIVNYATDMPFLQVEGQFNNPAEAAQYMLTHKPDLLFLDIEMPFMNGLSFLSSLDAPPLTIIITAYPEHAIKGYELKVIDYLLKPVSFNRFQQACNKAKEYYEFKNGNNNKDNFFFVKCDYKYEKIMFDEILYIEAMQNYIAIYTTTEKLITHNTMKNIENYLPLNLFIRVHKSYLISVLHINSIENNVLSIGGTKIPISRDNKDEILQRILSKRTASKRF